MTTFLYFLFFLLIGSAAYAGVSAAPWVPTRKRDRTPILNRITLKPHETGYDLGCGDGTLLFDLARRFPQTRLIGYEISLLPLAIAYLRKWAHPKKYRNVSLRFGNLFTKKYEDADLLFIFLLEKAYPKLKPVFAQIPDHALVIIEAWQLPGILPRDVIREEKTLPFYIYEGIQLK